MTDSSPQAADLGLPVAMGEMAGRYREAKDYPRAFDQATKAANGGDPKGMFVLGHCYTFGQGVAKDAALGLKWFEGAAAKGNQAAMHRCGLSYAAGTGCKKDAVKAVSYFERAIDLPEAMNELGNCYYAGEGVEKNLVTASNLFVASANLNCLDADVNIGQMMICGEGVARNVVSGFRHINKAAVAGNPISVAYMAEIADVVGKWKKSAKIQKE